jgi:hypothetical protein
VGNLGADVHVSGKYIAVRWFEENIVEGDALVSYAVLHGGTGSLGKGFVEYYNKAGKT